MRGWTRKAAESGAHLVAFPEMMLTGYPVEDLVFRESFVAASQAAAADAGSRPGRGRAGRRHRRRRLPRRRRSGRGSAPRPPPVAVPATRSRCCATVGCVATYFKHHLPNYGVFDEDRYFVPGDTLQVVRLVGPQEQGIDIALTICEDLWQAGGPFAAAASARVGLVVNINGSPYELNKDDVRLPLVRRRAAEAGAVVAYVNMVGGQDELVFDGDSMVVTADGTVLAAGSSSPRSCC